MTNEDKDIRDKVLKTMLNTPPKPHDEHEKTSYDFEEIIKDLPKAKRHMKNDKKKD